MNKENEELLTLNLKKEWYDMIESGEKKEEYRELKSYWFKRLTEEHGEASEFVEIKHFDKVKFVYGYTKRSMIFKIDDITISTGNVEWGAEEGKKYFVIKIGERIR